ncbi:septal ring lytic transglycosylase RlpA family protein [Sphingomonas sp.]|uniref:septal ring lytic transglycosylase RlpA family protein n=1 Tax=Sphingomonas sp. TaxID=28214 RepID=UPI0035B12184
MAVAALLFGPAFSVPALAGDQPSRNGAAESRKPVAKPRTPRVQRAAKTTTTTKPQLVLTNVPFQTTASAPSDGSATWRQTGIASWYGGSRWQGNRTASGARYDQNQLTAAHATLPIGTKVRVTLEGTDRSVVVLINDRPGTRRRIIDLSRSAAAELGILTQGIAVVTLTAL